MVDINGFFPLCLFRLFSTRCGHMIFDYFSWFFNFLYGYSLLGYKNSTIKRGKRGVTKYPSSINVYFSVVRKFNLKI